MQINKNGIPVQRRIKHPRRDLSDHKLKQRTFITFIDGIEVSAVIADFAPVVKLLTSSGWREAQ